MATNPMHQFKVYRIGPEVELSGVDLSFTNASLFMVISAGLIALLLLFGTKEKKLIPGKVQLVAEMLYNFIAKMISYAYYNDYYYAYYTYYAHYAYYT